ncbi:DUF257 family protein [Thermococcus henrietii]|uniref:DUF257 family protein n=1 Tax=Thermococcus henrietii TaxID=2016361 RepID=UPI001CB78AE0|nr:DUF257 family protein [Thermococcus henrietii]
MGIAEIVMSRRTSALVEHTSEDIVGYALVRFLRDVAERYNGSMDIIITDFVDALPVYLYQAELLGLDTEFFSDVSVIKVGGKINVGNVLYKVPISPYPVYKTRYEDALSKIVESRAGRVQLNVQLGIEMVMNLFDRKELIEQIHDIGRQIIQNKDVINVVFVNVEAVERASSEALPLLRVMFPMVVQLRGGGETFTVRKSVFPRLRGISGEV